MLNSSSGSEDVDSHDCMVDGSKMSAWLWLTQCKTVAVSVYIFLLVHSTLTSTHPNNKLLFDFGYQTMSKSRTAHFQPAT